MLFWNLSVFLMHLCSRRNTTEKQNNWLQLNVTVLRQTSANMVKRDWIILKIMNKHDCHTAKCDFHMQQYDCHLAYTGTNMIFRTNLPCWPSCSWFLLARHSFWLAQNKKGIYFLLWILFFENHFLFSFVALFAYLCVFVPCYIWKCVKCSGNQLAHSGNWKLKRTCLTFHSWF